MSYSNQMHILTNALQRKEKELSVLSMCKPNSSYEKQRVIVFRTMLLSTKKRWDKKLQELKIEKKMKGVMYPRKTCKMRDTYVPFV